MGVPTRRPPLTAMALVWGLVVLLVGAVTFVVVDRAGREVGQASAASSLAVVPATSSGGTGTASTAPSSTPSVRPTTPATTTRPPRTTSPTHRPPTSGTHTTRPPATTPPPPAPTTRTASFTTQGGTVVASCTGTAIRLGSITVRDGWRVEQDAERGGIEVHFRSGEREIELALRCSGGVPTQVSSSSSGAGGDDVGGR